MLADEDVDAAATLGTTGALEAAGTVIGRYRLLQKIGEGGMGEVWLADQREPVTRRVALKLVKTGMNTREVVARFESERQALALMDHPAIAKVLDAGSTPQSLPYFVMEYVAGVPITDFCDSHRLSTRDRLELFVRVCEGVQHAHQKAIIHRDLKPSNILVAEVDGRAAPKIIDFGVAKALTRSLTAETLFTRAGSLVGTPEYMSPEQALSSAEDIDTRSDVYSLGIIFYELLAGAPPIDLRKVALDEFLRRLREEDPPKPSTKISTGNPASSADVARKRQTEPPTLVRQIRGDLDAIALKALEKERSRRYASASDFAGDIRRYLNHEAVLAVPPSAAYRTSKFARRHRLALATAAAFLVVLIMAAAISIRQSIRANREAAVAQAVNDFLQNDVLAQASATSQSASGSKPDPDLKVRTALDRAATRIGGKFDQQPEVEASIRNTTGKAYMDLGLFPEAQKQFAQALDLYRRSLGPQNAQTLKTMTNLGAVELKQDQFAQALALLDQAGQVQRRVLGPEHPDTLESMFLLAQADSMVGKYAQAEALFRQTLEIRRRVLGPEHPDTVRSMTGLAYVYDIQDKLAEEEALNSQILEIRRRVLGPEHPNTLWSMMRLGMSYEDEGKYAQAEALYRQTLEIQRRVLGADHPQTADTMLSLVETTYEMGNYAQAEALAEQTLSIMRKIYGPDNIETLSSMRDLAEIDIAEGKYDKAEPMLGQALETRRRIQGPQHLATISSLSDLASMYQRQGKYALAEDYAAQATAGFRQVSGPENEYTMRSACGVALAEVSQEKFSEAEPIARKALEVFRLKEPDDWYRFRAETLLGASLSGERKYAEAEPLLLEGYQGLEARKDHRPAPDAYHLDCARGWLVQLYQSWGKPEKAADWRKK